MLTLCRVIEHLKVDATGKSLWTHPDAHRTPGVRNARVLVHMLAVGPHGSMQRAQELGVPDEFLEAERPTDIVGLVEDDDEDEDEAEDEAEDEVEEEGEEA